jgi:uncharacterized protein involved in tolerance to divalent cations
MTVYWLVVTCNGAAEASKIGRMLLKRRLVGCYDVLPRTASGFFWPPKKGKIASAKGSLLIATTLFRHIAGAKKKILVAHSDKVPFIGTIQLEHINPDYYHWLVGELAKHA